MKAMLRSEYIALSKESREPRATISHSQRGGQRPESDDLLFSESREAESVSVSYSQRAERSLCE